MPPDVRPVAPRALNFIQQIVEDDLRRGLSGVVTRFPPEPNGYLHLGHAMAVCLQFGVAADYGGRCHLRFDDTNPETEDLEYVDAAQRDIRWLGFDWGPHLYFASDYFERLYEFAERLIRDGKAYVDSLAEEAIRAYRGTVTEPGRPSPHRDRTVAESLDLFRRMRAGEFPEGAHVLRARIDMASPNMLLRDPVLYRIKYFEHYRRGRDWCIYPLYDFAHPLSDAIEGITHSLCTLEFDVHRPLYDWLVEALFDEPRPRQYEYARRNLEYTVVSKRRLLRLVKEGYVDGWDDPRMPTIAAARRRGIPPEAITRFADLVGVAKAETRIDISLLEHSIRDELNHRAPRVMAVLRPLRVVLTNWPEDRVEWLPASYWPHDVPRSGTRPVPFARTLFIEREDFAESPPRGFHRLSPGREVRLRHAWVVRCDEVIRDPSGGIVELRCTLDPDTRSGEPGGRRVKGTIHWVSERHAVPVEVRLYDRLFSVPNPEDVGEGETFLDRLTPASKEVVTAFAEPVVAEAAPEDRFQFERQGYFFADPVDSAPGRPVFNRTITLRDTWAKISGTGRAAHASAADGARQGTDVREPPGTRTGMGVPEADGSERPIPAMDAVQAADAQRPIPAMDAVRAADARRPIPAMDAVEAADAARLSARWGIPFGDAAILAVEPDLGAFFEEAAALSDNPRAVANWAVQELQRERRAHRDHAITPARLARIVALVDEGTLSSRLAREVFAEVASSGNDPDAVVRERGLVQIDDTEALSAAVARVISAHPDRVEAYRGGKTGLLGFFIGRVMDETRGRANPRVARELLVSALGD